MYCKDKVKDSLSLMLLEAHSSALQEPMAGAWRLVAGG